MSTSIAAAAVHTHPPSGQAPTALQPSALTAPCAAAAYDSTLWGAAPAAAAYLGYAPPEWMNVPLMDLQLNAAMGYGTTADSALENSVADNIAVQPSSGGYVNVPIRVLQPAYNHFTVAGDAPFQRAFLDACNVDPQILAQTQPLQQILGTSPGGSLYTGQYYPPECSQSVQELLVQHALQQQTQQQTYRLETKSQPAYVQWNTAQGAPPTPSVADAAVLVTSAPDAASASRAVPVALADAAVPPSDTAVGAVAANEKRVHKHKQHKQKAPITATLEPTAVVVDVAQRSVPGSAAQNAAAVTAATVVPPTYGDAELTPAPVDVKPVAAAATTSKQNSPRSWAQVLSAPVLASPVSAPALVPSKPAAPTTTAAAPKSKPAVSASYAPQAKAQPPQPHAQAQAQTAAPKARFPGLEELLANRGNIDLAPPATARFFVIKSYSEDDVHKSIKYSVWASTDSGNRRLDRAYRELNSGAQPKGPIYLLFSVNASGQFCGLAEMTSVVDTQQQCSCWQLDGKWKGMFRVRWLLVKDVPNAALRHIRLANNENKPVTNSRDTQEVPYEQGLQLLNVVSSYRSRTSLLDYFDYFEQREADMLRERGTTSSAPAASAPTVQSPVLPQKGKHTKAAAK
eukprot:TRINITY_DN847_c0_g1_i1.p1 TRINITY_DN847_c0_g1~~TRINITY_DN847_c0_g1_i1.p1  ORF type:complete len:628 (-),score=177.38 TRINITY_DN847_c0_g1_i1:1522-3405(-)